MRGSGADRLARLVGFAAPILAGRRFFQNDHLLVYGSLAIALAALVLVYWWKRRRLRRERS